jgi:hypothetical protein
MTVCETTELFYQEFLSPLYTKYEDDPRFTVSDEDGDKIWDLQYALLQECAHNNLFEPILYEEDGCGLVVGFRVNGKPQFILTDAQYSKKDNGAPLLMLMDDAQKYFMETGERSSLITYVGFSDVYLKTN